MRGTGRAFWMIAPIRDGGADRNFEDALEDYYLAVAIYSVAARVDLHHGDVAPAAANVTSAPRLPPLCT